MRKNMRILNSVEAKTEAKIRSKVGRISEHGKKPEHRIFFGNLQFQSQNSIKYNVKPKKNKFQSIRKTMRPIFVEFKLQDDQKRKK